MSYPTLRMRRLRRTPALRRMVAETRLSPDNLILPLFVCPGEGVREEIAAMPGNFHLSIDNVVEEARTAVDVGVPAVIMFGLPENKDEQGSDAWSPDAPVQRAATPGTCLSPPTSGQRPRTALPATTPGLASPGTRRFPTRKVLP